MHVVVNQKLLGSPWYIEIQVQQVQWDKFGGTAGTAGNSVVHRDTGGAGIEGYMWLYSRRCWELEWYIEVQVQQVQRDTFGGTAVAAGNYMVYVQRYRCSKFRVIHVVVQQEQLGTICMVHRGTGEAGIEGYMWWYLAGAVGNSTGIQRYRCSRFKGRHVVEKQELLGTLWRTKEKQK